MAKALTDTELKKAIKVRCKDCCPDGKDEKLCKSCSISKITETNIRRMLLKYCKDCRNGNDFEVCNSEDCSLYKYMPVLIKEAGDKLKENLGRK